MARLKICAASGCEDFAVPGLSHCERHEAARQDKLRARRATGPMGGKPLVLEPWQQFRHGSVFGWKYQDTGLRRFRSTYHQVGKKNGKTTDTGVPMLYTQLFDGEAAPQGYCAATTKDQAGLLFKEMKRMITRRKSRLARGRITPKPQPLRLRPLSNNLNHSHLR